MTLQLRQTKDISDEDFEGFSERIVIDAPDLDPTELEPVGDITQDAAQGTKRRPLAAMKRAEAPVAAARKRRARSKSAKENPFVLDAELLLENFMKAALLRHQGDADTAKLLVNLVREIRRVLAMPLRHLLTGDETSTIEAALLILVSVSFLLRCISLKRVDAYLALHLPKYLEERLRHKAGCAERTASPAESTRSGSSFSTHFSTHSASKSRAENAPLDRHDLPERVTTALRLSQAARLSDVEAAHVVADLFKDAKTLARQVARENDEHLRALARAKALGDTREVRRLAARIRSHGLGTGVAAARLLESPNFAVNDKQTVASLASARPSLASTPLDVIEDGHLVPKSVRLALGILTHVLRFAGPIPDRIDELLLEIAAENGLVDEALERGASIRRNGAPILFIDELTTLTRKLVFDIWREERRIAVVYASADRPVENPFASLRIPFLCDRRRQLTHAYGIRTIPTLAEPIVGGVRLTAATGFADLRHGDPVAVPAWLRTFAQMGAIRRWTAKSYDKRFLTTLERRVSIAADSMTVKERRVFFENILLLIDHPVEENEAKLPVSARELDALKAARETFTNDIVRLRRLVNRALLSLEGRK